MFQNSMPTSQNSTKLLMQTSPGRTVYACRYLAGVPQVLLDFAKEINAKLGPMEEQRVRYGPDLYLVTTLGIKINCAIAAWLENIAATKGQAPEVCLTRGCSCSSLVSSRQHDLGMLATHGSDQ